MKQPSIDILIPTYKPGPEFAMLLRRLACQRYPARQVIIINTEEQYWDPALEAEYPGCRVEHIRREEFDHGGTRRRMAAMSQADLFLCMTQDALPADEDLIGNLVKAFENPLVKAAYARQLPREDCSLAEQFTRSFNYPPESRIKTQADLKTLGIKTFFCSDVCAAYDRKTYRELGGFPEQAGFNEDMIYASKVIRAGYAVAYAAEAQVIHSHNYTGRQQFRRNFDLGVSQADHPEIFAKYPSEGEGIRLVKQTAGFLVKKRKPWLLVPLVWQSACKYAGYWLGKRYRKLPGWTTKKNSIKPR